MDTWRKSSYSGSNGGSCVEVADSHNAVFVRDTTDREGGTLVVTTSAWAKFTANLK